MVVSMLVMSSSKEPRGVEESGAGLASSSGNGRRQ
jgi:hypothetical protein